MNNDIISQREAANTGRNIHCHYHPKRDTWVAYGKSAYGLQQIVERKGLYTIGRYSTELEMASIMVGKSALQRICSANNTSYNEAERYICITTTEPFDSSNYATWASTLKQRSMQKGHEWVHTAVSDHLPEGEQVTDGMNSFGRGTKRIADMLIAAICLVLFAPLFLITYIMVRMEDGGPAIFKQERVGRKGRTFNIYKFRSMRMDAEKYGPQLSHSSGMDDPRLTKVGRFIRAHHLDEIPQLWNVLIGDMAFIGPRPERRYYIDMIMEYDKRYANLYQIRPGVTSYATLYNGYTDTMEKMLRRLEYDLYYLGHRSWKFDIKILFYTFCSIVFGKKF
jgi:lipopolysaccharide/colanic/teichoic acid biosynthesis glycosyltransferase